MEIEFTPWRHFMARKNDEAIRHWLERVGKAAEEAFKSGMGHYPPASAPGAWPNIRTGALHGSVRHEVVGLSMIIGSNTAYARFLRSGTSKMARRKMSDNALEEGLQRAPGRLEHWVEWTLL